MSGPARARTATGAILGRITDASDAAVGGAAVSVTNEATGLRRTATSQPFGAYECLLLPPGRYRVDASAPGFKTAVRIGVELEVEGRARVDFRLEIGSITEHVTVVASGAPVQTETSALGTLVDTRQDGLTGRPAQQWLAANGSVLNSTACRLSRWLRSCRAECLL